MSVWSIAAAQSGSRPGNIAANIEHHLSFVRQAAEHQVDFLMFPELSLTGYELALASELAMPMNDARLDVFADAAAKYRMSIVTGLPLQDGESTRLAALTFLPDGTRLAYFKRNLVEAEKLFFEAGQSVPLFGYQHHYVAMAVCADISVEEFARDAASRGANLYATSVLLSENGYAKDCEYLARWAREFNIAVLMANHALPTGGYQSAGKSAIWDENGRQIAVGGSGEQLIIARRKGREWSGEAQALRTAIAL
ncbi:carbon-nitrogen hydrolase family protein [Kalamiella sp. sgz302252]|uniref:carbon-nitrogen hydrolase family protein n=1 Tax=Pantoea sp. sgz302252 TaxID=3341827 RepID=UPI0036D3AFAA